MVTMKARMSVFFTDRKVFTPAPLKLRPNGAIQVYYYYYYYYYYYTNSPINRKNYKALLRVHISAK